MFGKEVGALTFRGPVRILRSMRPRSSLRMSHVLRARHVASACRCAFSLLTFVRFRNTIVRE